MALVEVFGWGTEFRIYPITKKLASELTKRGVSSERLEEICSARWKKEIGEAGLGLEFEIVVDGKPLHRRTINSIATNVVEDTVLPSGKCYLVKSSAAKGCWVSVTTSDDFDRKKLRISVFNLVLPDGSKNQLLDVSYDGENEFGDTITKVEECYVIFEDGSTAEVVENDDFE